MIFLHDHLSKQHLNSALNIYNYYISNSFSNFEDKRLSRQAFNKLYQNIKKNKLPFIIAIKNNIILGLAYVNKFREKSGYRYTYEHSIYINPEFVKQKYGSRLLKELVKQCKKNKKIKNLIAVIGGSDNIGSIKIHKKNGFNYIGTLKKVGFKKDKWIDSVYMQKIL